MLNRNDEEERKVLKQARTALALAMLGFIAAVVGIIWLTHALFVCAI